MRQCVATTRAGTRCQSYAVWGDLRQLCTAHGGKRYPTTRTCTCAAYPFPHRPGGGLCRWPEEPLFRLDIEPGKHGAGWRRRRWRKGDIFAISDTQRVPPPVESPDVEELSDIDVDAILKEAGVDELLKDLNVDIEKALAQMDNLEFSEFSDLEKRAEKPDKSNT